MKAVWAYKYLPSKRQSIMRWYLFIASVYSWRRFAPQFRRVLYLDKDTKEILSNLGNALSLWDEIISLEFNDVLARQGNNYWCNAQNYVQTLQTEPFWLLDSDVILKQPIGLWFDPTKYYGHLYIDRLDPKYGVYRGEDIDFYEKIYNEDRGLQLLNDPTGMIDGGYIYYADPKVGILTGYTLLGIQSKYCNKHYIENGVDNLEVYQNNIGSLVEEAVYPKIFELLGIRLENIGEPGYREYIEQYFDKDRPFENYLNVRNQIDGFLHCNLELRYHIHKLEKLLNEKD